MKRISLQEAKELIPLKESYLNPNLEQVEFFTLSPSDRGEGWEDITYYTSRKKNKFSNRGKGDQWVYILSNPTQPGIFKIGYTKLPPEERAKQISSATGVVIPYEVIWAFACFNGEQLEGEVHRALKRYRVNPNREFFNVDLEEAKNTIKTIGKNYI